MIIFKLTDFDDALNSNVKLLADDTSSFLFSVAHDNNISTSELNSNLEKTNFGHLSGIAATILSL